MAACCWCEVDAALGLTAGLWLAAFAYLLLERLRTWGLAGTELAKATVGSVRLRLLKVAAQVRLSVRRVLVQLSSA